MIYYFRKSKILYITLSALWVVGMVSANVVQQIVNPQGEIPLLLETLILIAGFVGIFYLCSWVASQEQKRVMDILNEECDPEHFAEVCSRMAEEAKKPQLKALFEGNVAVGYIAGGRADEAVGLLTRNVLPETDFNAVSNNNILYSNLCSCCLDKRDLNGAEFYLQKMAEQKSKIPYNGAYFQTMADVYENLLRRIDCLKGNYAPNLPFFEQKYASAPNKYMKAVSAYRAAEICSRMGESEKMREYCAYVIQNGNKLAVVHMAAELLDRSYRAQKPAETTA